MANAAHDENGIPTLIAALNTDGATPIKVKVVAATHGLEIEDNTTGSDNGPADALHDDNRVTTLLAVSSDDGVTPVVVYADSDGNLLIDSN